MCQLFDRLVSRVASTERRGPSIMVFSFQTICAHIVYVLFGWGQGRNPRRSTDTKRVRHRCALDICLSLYRKYEICGKFTQECEGHLQKFQRVEGQWRGPLPALQVPMSNRRGLFKKFRQMIAFFCQSVPARVCRWVRTGPWGARLGPLRLFVIPESDDHSDHLIHFRDLPPGHTKPL